MVEFDPTAFVADPELVAALENRSAPFRYEVEQVLFQQGDPADGLYLLEEGEVTLTMGANGTAAMHMVLSRPGSLLGLPGLAGNQPYTLTAIAQPGTRVRFVTRADFAALMQSDPAMSLKILKVLAAEVRAARRTIV